MRLIYILYDLFYNTCILFSSTVTYQKFCEFVLFLYIVYMIIIQFKAALQPWKIVHVIESIRFLALLSMNL